MEENSKNVLWQEIFERRRRLSELRTKVIKARERNEVSVSVNQGHKNTKKIAQVLDDDLMENWSNYWSLANSCKITPDDKTIGQPALNIDFDSDDSVKDKNYEPNQGDFDSSCSEIS